MNDRPRPKDDRELEQLTGIRPADHPWTRSAAIDRLEREVLGRDWFRPRPKKEQDA